MAWAALTAVVLDDRLVVETVQTDGYRPPLIPPALARARREP